VVAIPIDISSGTEVSVVIVVTGLFSIRLPSVSKLEGCSEFLASVLLAGGGGMIGFGQV
jgi:hypothetical protein